MSQSSAVQTIATAPAHGYEPLSGHDLLYKVDRPRCIDRYIDFFGDGAQAAADRCGEIFLESLA